MFLKSTTNSRLDRVSFPLQGLNLEIVELLSLKNVQEETGRHLSRVVQAVTTLHMSNWLIRSCLMR